MSRSLHRYTAYGLRVQSPIALPFVPASSAPHHEPDVTIRVGAAPLALPAPVDKRRHWQSAPGAFLLNVDGVARYLVTAGRDILVEPHGGGDGDVGTCPGSASVRRTFAPSRQWRGQALAFRVKRPAHPLQINALADEIERSLCEHGAETVSPAAGASG